MLSIEFVIATIVIVLVPGTGIIHTVSTGLLYNRVAMFYAAVGCTLAITPHILASVFGLAALLKSSHLAFQVFKFLGVFYLMFMAYKLFIDKSRLELSSNSVQGKYFSYLQSGFLLNLLNPKLSVFFLAFLPQFVVMDSLNATYDMLFLGVFFMLVTFVVFIVYGLCANLFQQKLQESNGGANIIQKLFAVIFGFLAYKMAMMPF